MKRCLNLGCGADYKKNTEKEIWTNTDISKKVKADYYFDVGKDRWPFETDFFDYTEAKMIFEHLHDFEQRQHFLKELHRVCRNDGKIFLTVPHFSSASAWADLQHVRPFSTRAFDYFAVNQFLPGMKKLDQEIEGNSNLFKVFPSILFGRFHKKIGCEYIFNKKKFMQAWELYLYWLFPARELHFIFRVVK